MTDRRVGGLGANVDIRADPDRRLGALGVNVDVRVQLIRSVPLSATLSLTIERNVPLNAVFVQHAERSIGLAGSLSLTSTRSVPLSAQFQARLGRNVPLAVELGGALTERQVGGLGANVDVRVDPQRRVGALGAMVDLPSGGTFERTIPISAQLDAGGLVTRSRSVPISARLSAGPVSLERSIPLSLILAAERWVPLSVVFFASRTRSIPIRGSTRNAAAVEAELSVPFSGVFEEGTLPPDPEPEPPDALVTSTRQVPLSVLLGQGLTVPLTMPVALSPLDPTDYQYVWSVPESGPDCISASRSIPGDPSDTPRQETGASEEAIYVQVDLSGSAPEGGRFGAVSRVHSALYGWHSSGSVAGFNSWNPWTAQRITNWHDIGSYGIHDRAEVSVLVFGGAHPTPGGYSATACFTWRKRQEPEPDPPPCATVQLTTEWYRTSIAQHFSPRVPYDYAVPVPWQARRFRVWFMPFEGDTMSTPTVMVRNSTLGYLPYVKDRAEYFSVIPTRLGIPYYVGDWIDPIAVPGGPRMTGLHMLIGSDDQSEDSIPWRQGQQMKASVIIEWDCENSIGIPISAVFEPRHPRGPFVQIVG